MVRLIEETVEASNLFSRHYLETRLKESEGWDCTGHDAIFEKIKELYTLEKDVLEDYNESQLEENFIKPVLKLLGHSYEVQQPGDSSRLTPDYVFFPDEKTKTEAHKDKEFYKSAIALGDAKSWKTPMDKKSKGREEFVNNPSLQIDGYLRKNDIRWGILTNGKYWRLYFIETSYRLNSYYEADLQVLLEKGNAENFKYFYLFFRRDAFIKDESDECFLDRVQSQSNKYAKEIGDDLEKKVYRALRVLAQGFVNWKDNGISLTEEDIRELHENCLIFLYRLLFIFYADSRGTLKVPTKAKYFNINWINAKATQLKIRGEPSPYSPDLYNTLTELFNLIDVGSEGKGIPKEDMYVPPYNGGLFHSEERPFLAGKKVGDAAVAEVLELLTRSENGNGGFIDYSTLEIRHLGSIYEGLLEYKLRVANKDMVSLKEKGGEVWIPKEEAENRTPTDSVQEGYLYLATDKGERKATGSYYTPEYIVKYIVENTIGPVIKEKLKDAKTDEERLERILSIRVLDPAMGSGHFLVEAADFLASQAVNFIDSEEIGEESEKEWALREVVRRCIYGVDLNPLATELAKLSLWLNSISKERPLSFLDHHLKVGNSLIGANLKNLSSHPKEAGGETAPTFISDFLDETVREKIEIFVNMHLTIMKMAEEDIADIKAKEATYRQFESDIFRQAFIQLANLHNSYWLGNKFTKEEYYSALEAFRHFSRDRTMWDAIREKDYFKRAQDLAREKRFFHWELAFSDVFYGESVENPGFDAVIGNPPYGAFFSDEDKLYLKCSFQSAQQVFDSFATFIEQSIDKAAKKKFIGMIVPSGWLTAIMHRPLRNFILKKCDVPYIIHLPYDVFPDAYIDTIIFIACQTGEGERLGYTNVIRFGIREDAQVIVTNKLDYEEIDNSFWKEDEQNRFLTVNPTVIKIQRKLDKLKVNTSQLLDVSRGITPFKEASDDTTRNTTVGFSGSVPRYGLEGTFKTVIYDESLAEFKPEKFFKGPRLIIRRIISRQHRIHATYITDDFVINKSYLPALQTGKNYSLLYTLALLNSKLFSRNFIWSSEIAKRDDFPQLDIATVRGLPIRRISFTTTKDERARLVSELKELYAEFNFPEIISRIESYLPKDASGNFLTEKEKSDVIHDFLAFLAEQMTDLNKEKQAEIKGFLEWLERHLEIKIEDMNLKTKVRAFYEFGWDEYYRVLKKSSGKTKVKIDGKEAHDTVKEAFDSSVGRLRPLLERIERTDELIDQVVYKLYGLAEEEIRVVEES